MTPEKRLRSKTDAADAVGALLALGVLILLGGLIALICGGGPLP
jgi:hypothetical protein